MIKRHIIRVYRTLDPPPRTPPPPTHAAALPHPLITQNLLGAPL